ncbi:MAG: porin family protein [Rikenellaceae bacterium]
MKRIILSIAATMAVVLSANAIDLSSVQLWGYDVQLGAKVGMNISNVTGLEDTNAKIGLTFGVTGEIDLNDQSGVGVELLFSRQGYSYKADDYKFKERYTYLNIPILYQYNLKDIVTFKAGLQPGIKMAANYREKVGDTRYKGKLIGVKTFDMAIPIGASYLFEKYNTAIDLRYNIGLTNIYNTGSSQKCRNSNFTISAQYLF